MTKRRVVVTGLGCLAPVGNSVAESWANLLAGNSGIDTITKFDVSAFSCKFAGEVKGFDIKDYIPEKEARHMDRFIHLGLAAAIQAVQDSGLPTGIEDEDAFRIGAEVLPLSAGRGRDLFRNERPSSNELLLQGLLLGESIAYHYGKA